MATSSLAGIFVDDREKAESLIEEDRIPLFGETDYSQKAVKIRQRWIKKRLGIKPLYLSQIPEETSQYKGNIEHLVGVVQVPVGIIGPLKINGTDARGNFYIPLATTEGVLVSSFHRGARLITKSGGANVKIKKFEMHVSPVLVLSQKDEIRSIIKWVSDHFNEIKKVAEKTTAHGKLLRIRPRVVGTKIILKMIYDTKDAMGMNMITIASDQAVKYIARHCKVKTYYPRSNYSSDKKYSVHIAREGYGRWVYAEALIRKEFIRYLGTSAKKMYDCYMIQREASKAAGMPWINGQIANGIASVFIATGQDPAQVVNSAIGESHCRYTRSGDLFINVSLPCLLVGTVGGGTRRGYARECLQILGCYGTGHANKFAEIIGGLVLAGELSILGALASGTFVEAHKSLGR